MSQIADGVTKEISKPGTGPTPNRGATITVHCTGSVVNADDTTKKFWR